MSGGIAPVVETTGGGDAVVLVHGLGGTGNVWMAQVPVLARYFSVVRPELSGSGRAPLRGPVSVAEHVEDVLAAMAVTGVETAHFVGHSYGTVLCQHLAARYPEKVRSLALFGPIRQPADAARQALRDRAAVARDRGMVGIADATVQMGTSAETKAHRPEIAAFVRELVMRQDPEGYARTCESIAAIVPADVSHIHCPTLIVTGDEDNTSPPAAARAVADSLAGARFVVLGRCGHWTPLERAEQVTELLIEFLFSQPPQL
jgi:3-oxoadipate enol-lactonase